MHFHTILRVLVALYIFRSIEWKTIEFVILVKFHSNFISSSYTYKKYDLHKKRIVIETKDLDNSYYGTQD